MILKGLVIASLLVSMMSAANPGIQASLDMDVVKQAKDAYFDTIIKTINGL